jgi:subtilisin family serine protease
MHINVPAAHQQHPTVRGSGVTIAILDTGIDSTHLTVGEFSQRDAGGYNALDGGGSDNDNQGHGTHMTGIIAAAANNTGIIGAAPNVNLAAVKVLDQNGNGYVSDVIDGFQWVHNNGIRLVNVSLGFSTDSKPLQKAIQSLYNSGMIMVAAAGNRCSVRPSQDDGAGADCLVPSASCAAPLTSVLYPAAYSGVIAVGATDINNQVTAYSLTGPQVDVVAPGGDMTSRILSTNLSGGYGEAYGTSQAAAHVSGTLALALQCQPQLSPNDARSRLQECATGLIDAACILKKLCP